jgi:hypothetical protein
VDGQEEKSARVPQLHNGGNAKGLATRQREEHFKQKPPFVDNSRYRE